MILVKRSCSSKLAALSPPNSLQESLSCFSSAQLAAWSFRCFHYCQALPPDVFKHSLDPEDSDWRVGAKQFLLVTKRF